MVVLFLILDTGVFCVNINRLCLILIVILSTSDLLDGEMFDSAYVDL